MRRAYCDTSRDQISIGNDCTSGWPTWKGPRHAAQEGRSYLGNAAACFAIGRWPDGGARISAPKPLATNAPAPPRLSEYPSARNCASALSSRSRATRSPRSVSVLEMPLGEHWRVRVEHRQPRDAQLARELARRRHGRPGAKLRADDTSAKRVTNLPLERLSQPTIDGNQIGK